MDKVHSFGGDRCGGSLSSPEAKETEVNPLTYCDEGSDEWEVALDYINKGFPIEVAHQVISHYVCFHLFDVSLALGVTQCPQ